LFKGTLRPFQIEAVEFLLETKAVLLSHPLGSGKTIEAVAATEVLIDEGIAKSVLAITPASVKWQWARQIQKFTDGALVTVVEGNKAWRQRLYRKLMRGEIEYLLMNYEQVVNDWEIVKNLKFDVVIADECQYIKSPRAKRSRYVKRLQAPYKFGLTGQPIENRPEELFSIMQWINPDVLGRFDIFDRTFIKRNGWGGVQYYKNLPLLRKTMTNAMHRKTREEIADQLPAVIEEDQLIDFDSHGRRLYHIIAGELIEAIQESGNLHFAFNVERHYRGEHDDMTAYGEIMPRIMALRMLCDHPELLRISADRFDDPDTKLGSEYAAELKDRGLLDGVTAAPKLTVTLDLINELLSEDPANKVVLFSFFKPMLGIISDALKVEHVVFTGDLTPRQRDAAIQEFSNNPKCRVFLSSDAGGVGVDLPIANYLISYDLPWSAGKWEQRNGRIIRLSSEWGHVTLLSMLMRGSIEERMLDMLQTKSEVAGAWLDGKGVDSAGKFTLTLGTLLDFLSEMPV
jgi:SNF2 family DNA or RNA helicase